MAASVKRAVGSQWHITVPFLFLGLTPIDRGSTVTLDSIVLVLKLKAISIASGSSFHWLVLLSVVKVTALSGGIRKGTDFGQLGPLA